jgi:hypothetical protein
MVRWSKHTLDEMGKRRITLTYIQETIAAPDRRTADPTNPTLTRAYKVTAAFARRIPTVVHRPDGAGVFVVTAHRHRGVKI